jgi:hypothetical protein
MKSMFHSLAATLAVVAVLFTPGASSAPGAGGEWVSILPGAPAASRSAPVVGCKRPSSLRLIRFEDGSAQLRCGRRILVRVSTPG